MENSLFCYLFVSFLHVSLSFKTNSTQTSVTKVHEYILDGLDRSKNPCDSFYSYSCGNWIKNNKGKGDYQEEQGKSMLQLKTKLFEEIKRIDLKNAKDYAKSVRVFFNQCLNVKFDKKREAIDLYNAVENLVGPFPMFVKNAVFNDGFDPWSLNGILESFLQSEFLFKASVELADKNCLRVPILVLEPLISWSDINEYEYKLEERLTEIASQLNIELDEEYLKKEIYDVVALRKQLFRLYAKTPLEDSRIKLTQLQDVLPEINWDTYLEQLFDEDFRLKYKRTNPEVILRCKDYFRQLSKVLAKFSNRTVVNFAYLQVMRVSSQLLRLRSDELSYGPNEGRCFELTLKHQLPSLIRTYFDRTGVSLTDWKYDVELMMQSIFSAFRYLVTSIDWLDSREKIIIIKKSRQITFLSGIPDWITNDDALRKIAPSFDEKLTLYENDLVNGGRKFAMNIQRLLNPRNVEDPRPDLNYNAQYGEKTIYLFLGFALPPYYHLNYPLAKKYGALGWIIAHELMHSFDSNWFLRERVNGVNGWLGEDALKMFYDKNHCLVKQYSKFCYHDLKLCVRGRRTINDNIADVNGLKVAFLAYKFARQILAHDEPPLPTSMNMTNDEMFFLSAARVWCGDGEEVSTHIRFGEDHAPRHARVDVSMKNFPMFAKTYKCPIGSNMAPIETCSLWGDIVGPI